MVEQSKETSRAPGGGTSKASFSGLGWVALASLSGVALIVAVVLNLRSALADRERQAQWATQRTEELGAKELRRLLLHPDLIEQVNEGHTFGWVAGRVGIPESVGWLIAGQVGGDSHMDAVARDLVQRAQGATPSQAGPLWKRALEDPGVGKAALDHLRMQAAWFAHRSGQDEWCQSLLDSVSHGALPGVRASRVLLRSIRDGALPPGALAVFGHLDQARARGLIARLQERGLSLPGALDWSQEQALHRARLRRLLPLQETLSEVTEATWWVLDSDLLAVVFPGQQRGVWLSRGALESWAQVHAGVPLQLVEVDGSAPNGAGKGVQVVPGFVAARLPIGAGESALSGPVLLAILVAALAALCGAGAWLALRAAAREAQSARLKGEFLTTVTHELKTPLAGIRLVSELLADDHVQDPEKRRSYLKALSAESTRLSMLIENVLDLRRMESGQRVHDAQPEELGELVRDTVELFEPLLERSGNQVVLSELHSPLQVLVDRDDLRQAFLNLLDNSRKYGGGGDVHVQLSGRGTHAILRLTDAGPGIDPAEREAIFERFARGKAHQHGGIPGVGIGLNLARAILRRQGGELMACDPPVGCTGACFELSLPLYTPEQSRTPSGATES